MVAARRARRAWDYTKLLSIVGSILLLAHQAVDLRGKVKQQEESSTVVASSVAALQKDVAKLRKEVDQLKRKKPVGVAAAPADTSKAPKGIVARIVALPQGFLRWLIGAREA